MYLKHDNFAMPIIFEKTLNNTKHLVLWEITESKTFFLDYLSLPVQMINELNKITHPSKQLEWLASRSCVKYLLNKEKIPFTGLLKDEHNNPHFENNQFKVSITHSHQYAAAVMDSINEVGIDIEQKSDKLLKVANKFLNNQEYKFAQNNVEILCKIWCAKESLYKLYGKRNLSFKENISIKDFHKDDTSIEGKIIEENSQKNYSINIYNFNDFILTVV